MFGSLSTLTEMRAVALVLCWRFIFSISLNLNIHDSGGICSRVLMKVSIMSFIGWDWVTIDHALERIVGPLSVIRIVYI
jgi:hypothetical protein